jgi:hypothetical protein
MDGELRFIVCYGHDELEVVGESHYQHALRDVVGRETGRVRHEAVALLVAEQGNPSDSNAVSVWIARHKVGYLARDDAAAVRPGLVRKIVATGQAVALEATIVGGGVRADGQEGLLGVWLAWDPADFGLGARMTPVEPPPLRTGLSTAMVSDLADDSYDLAWQRRLPEDGPKRLKVLRSLLDTEQAPLSRHYIYCQLESDLYAYRDTFPAALDEYDDVTVRHDAEMDAIRPVLMSKFGSIPLLETYRQASIRHAKGGADLERALWWAKRGLELYGDDAHEDDWTRDLDKRVAVLHARIDNRRTTDKRSTHVPAQVRVTADVEEVLVCQSCAQTFTRLRTRGRKPLTCPSCRSA